MEYNGKEVVLMACSSCNIKRCKHCYISYNGDRDPKELKDLASLLKSKKYDVYINGSEVLINYNYLKSFYECGQDWILTNGYAIYKDDAVLPLLKENGIEIIEMSYHFGIQDKISVVDKMILEKTIQKINVNGFKLKLLVTINCDNYDKVLDMCNQAIEIGAYGIEFTLFLNQGSAMNMDLNNMLTDEQKLKFFEQLKQARKTIDKNTLVIDRSGIFGKDFNNENCHFKCPAGKNLVVITPDNNVYPCMFLAKKGFEIGHVVDNKIHIDYNITNNGDRCLAYEVCNRGNVDAFNQLIGR